MKRQAAIWLALACAALSCCSGSPDGGPPPCLPIAAPPDSGAPPGVLWGFVDLHSHPAIEVAFSGNMVWGTALDDAPVNADQLPDIEPCPVETHNHDASAPVSHLVGNIIFPGVSKVASFAHAPVGDLRGEIATDAWPNARDVIHQGMNISSIRRAYEGGLRLMFASTTDNQVLDALLKGPNAMNVFVPDPGADGRSARKQIEFVETIVERNRNWMQIVNSPEAARSVIADGGLAIVLSLEMDGMPESDIEQLLDAGVAHIIPVHLIDNDIGGTAANADIFNSASAEVSEIYRSDHQPLGFMDVTASTAFQRNLGWAQQLTTLPAVPIFASFAMVPFGAYAPMCYEPLAYCSGQPPVLADQFLELGQINFRGLCTTYDECADGGRPGAARISRLMDQNLFIDVSHMSYRSVADTLLVDRGLEGGLCNGDSLIPPASSYPLMASHGEFAHLCDSPGAPADCTNYVAPKNRLTPSGGTERSIAADQAREIARRGGVLGLSMGVGNYQARTIVDARGGPLLSFDPSFSTSGCLEIAGDGDADGCQPTLSVGAASTNAGLPIEHLDIQTVGGISFSPSVANAVPYVRVELLGPDGSQDQRRIITQRLTCTSDACSTSIDFTGQLADALLDLDSGVANPCHGEVYGGPGNESVTACSVDQAATVDGGYSVDHVESVTLEWVYFACDADCQRAASTAVPDLRCANTSGSSDAPIWTVEQATVIAETPGQNVTLAQAGPFESPSVPVARLGQSRGQYVVYQREDRPDVGADAVTSGHLLLVSMISGQEALLPGANTSSLGVNVCAAVRQLVDGGCAAAPPPAADARECPAQGWVSLNQRGVWGTGTSLFTFLRYSGNDDAICGVDVSVLGMSAGTPAWTIDAVKVQAVEDPVAHFIRRYAEISKYVAGGHMGTVAFGTDFNGLNGMMDFSESPVPEGAMNPSACLLTAPAPAGAQPQALAPMRYLHSNGDLGDEVRIDERGLATYGLLADLVTIIGAFDGGHGADCGKDVRDSLMLSAEATIRMWETIRHPDGGYADAGLPIREFDCEPPSQGQGGGQDGGP